MLGCGTMGRSLLNGLLRAGWSAQRLCGAEPDAKRRDAAQQALNVRMCAQARDACAGAAVVVLAVKPQQLHALASSIADVLAPGTLVISVAAGVRLDTLSAWLGPSTSIIRAMPNTPATIGAGMSALYAAPGIADEPRARATEILETAGAVLWLEQEQQLDAVTAISGCGPAYFFLLMELLEQQAMALGLEPEQVAMLARQTALGAARLALTEPEVPAGQLRRQVTSPGGATEAALRELTQGGMAPLFERAIRAAHDRLGELAEETGRT